ncbi:MAG: carbamoyltransferase HypF [Planctomyces sp.]|nr:carbamoyltransferase HypF [Planctomyces sp.]
MIERRRIRVQGIVQGVGFRPAVLRLAVRHGLTGFVFNATGEVWIEAEGSHEALDLFRAELVQHAPPAARIELVVWERIAPLGGDEFRIVASDLTGMGPVRISPDLATCPDCLAELFDPADRRFRYAFLNCTNCGPRLTVATGAPWDRERTTLAGFPMCDACRAEYDDPADRRFHAQPIACPACGPQLRLFDSQGTTIPATDPVIEFAAAIRRGRIGAIKGLGGFHLVCDAASDEAVVELRGRKTRDDKPFAIMVGDIATARGLCEFDSAEEELLTGSRRPIVLLRRSVDAEAAIAERVAPRNPRLGVMLPYTPLHHLLLREFPGRALVMTSGNLSDEPIVKDDDEALKRLREIADLFLGHNRPIHVRCDDSVTRVLCGGEQPLRRARGYAPQPIRLPFRCPEPIFAYGGHQKAAFAIGWEDQAIVSHHLGELEGRGLHGHGLSLAAECELYQSLFQQQPQRFACDLHPDYESTRCARSRARQRELECGGMPHGEAVFAVQHHHAHLAAALADRGILGPAIGVIFDGAGLGEDGTIWGGEFLIGDSLACRRGAHLRPVGQPGGDRASEEPWRMAVAHLRDAGCPLDVLAPRIGSHRLRVVAEMLERNVNSPLTSSMGRLFDAVASISGVRDAVRNEGQAAMELEWLAAAARPAPAYACEWCAAAASPSMDASALTLDTRPLIRAVAADVQAGQERGVIARRFHATIADLIVKLCARFRAETGITTAVLSGGVFQNELLTEMALARLSREGFEVVMHRQVPPGDGGLCLGQLSVAAARLAARLQAGSTAERPPA